MAPKKPKPEPTPKAPPYPEKPERKGASRDYSQRAYDVVREAEKRHEDRQQDDPA